MLPDGLLALAFRPESGSLDVTSIGVTQRQPGMTFPTGSGQPVRTVLAFLPSPPVADDGWARDLAVGLAVVTGASPLWGGALPTAEPRRATRPPT